MTKLQNWLLVCFAGALTLGALWGGMGLTKHIIVAFDAWGAAAPNVQPTLDAISGPRGTLQQVNKAVVKIGDAVVTTQIQERAITPHTLAAVDSLATIAPHANSLMDSAAKTADSASETLAGASATLQTVNGKVGPLMDAYTGAGSDLDALLKSHALNQSLDNIADTTGNVKVLSGDLAFYAHPILHPDPCKTRKCVAGRVLVRAGQFTGVLGSAAQAAELFRPIPVKLK